MTCNSVQLNYLHESIKRTSVKSVFNPKADGNCGFRALAFCIYEDEDRWKDVKTEMLSELHKNLDFYQRKLFAGKEYEMAERILVCRDESVSIDNYFTAPEHPRIACEAFRRAIAVYSDNGENQTYVPFLQEPVSSKPLILQLAGLHFYAVVPKVRCKITLPKPTPGHEKFCSNNGYTNYLPLFF